MKLPFWGTFFTVLGMLVCCSLGIWQLQRLEWKSTLLAEIDSAYAADPMAFELNYYNLSGLPPEKNFVRGFVRGRFLNDRAVAIGPRTHEGLSGYHIITPFETTDNYTILVNRGWVPVDMKDGGYALPGGIATLTGIARRPPPPGMFTPQNDPERNDWYGLVPEEIALAKHLNGLLPYILYPDSAGAGGFPAAVEPLRPVNNHRSYAVFWFVLAVLLPIIAILRFLGEKG